MRFRRRWRPAVVAVVCITAVVVVVIWRSRAGAVWLDELDVGLATSGWGRPQRRRSVGGNRLRIGWRPYWRGVGLHAPSRFCIDLGGGSSRFTATVGIDRESGDKGSVEFRVLGDGKLLWASGVLHGGGTSRQVDVQVAGVGLLDLVVTTGGDNLFWDHADWADARLEVTGRRPRAALVPLSTAVARSFSHSSGKEQAAAPPANLPECDRQSSPATACEYAHLNRQIQERGGGDLEYQRRHKELQSQAFRRDSLILASDRDPTDVVLRRTMALLSHLKSMRGVADLSIPQARLDQLVHAAARTDVDDIPARGALFEQAVKLRRAVAFSNPLLDFDRVLFIKRHPCPPDAMQGNHMCDQYFGFHAITGGGLFVLEDAFGEEPAARDVLASSICTNGRFRGHRLARGGFLSPELSYDGETVLFAYTEALPTHYEWSERSTYHIFRVRVDGSDLTQLTDGPWNDFDPCCLPDGRIAFVSERRGGYGRCHSRPVPTFTLHTMDADGRDIVCISPHETNEWHPSMSHDGLVLYTRWDYVDRGALQAHHPWTVAPDGRDPRAVRGNYFESREDRTNMELSVRAIPDSHRLVATAAAHHGQAYGSLVVVDPRLSADAEGALRRLTPEVPFPEAEVGPDRGQVCATAWPLSEEFYLCVYDANGAAGRGVRNNYGIYLIDAFGNRELLYRDPEVSCLSPIPLRPRRRPPVVTTNGPKVDDRRPDPKASVGVVDVYDSLKPFPKGTRIKALRIIQVLPKTTPGANQPRIGHGRQMSARAVLGTVPVETDGSAYFELPVGKPVYFQALDERGLAVQSMRSDTWVQAGPRVVCQGCHEPRLGSPPLRASRPLAFARSPSKIEPDVDGANPFSFPRLVQPVLERNCLPCHAKHPKAPDLAKGDFEKHRDHWFTSYESLQDYAFFFADFRGWTEPRTTPGRFGARASKLFRMLDAGHNGLELSEADRRRLTLWLDCNSDFFGSYENTRAQARGEVVRPALE